MNLYDALRQIAPQLGLNPDDLIRYAAEDTLGGFHKDAEKSRWNVGSIWEGEGQFVYALLRALHPGTVFEAGIGNGCTSAHVLAALDANGDGILVSCDTYPLNPTSMNDHPRWHRYSGTGEAWLDAYPEATFEIAIEDTMHTHDMTRDILARAKRPGLRLALAHDAGHPTVGGSVSSGFVAAFGSITTVNIDDSDCGWGYWVDPSPAPAARWEVPPDFMPVVTSLIVSSVVYETSFARTDSNARILYLPIIEPGAKHGLALRTKRGLLTALAARASIEQFDYLAQPASGLLDEIAARIERTNANLLFTQIQGHEPITADMLKSIRERFPHLRVVNWNGDYWPEHLTSPAMLELLKHVDLQLVINADVLATYTEHGIRAAYWQFGYEPPVDPLPDVPAYDVVYLGNAYSDKRKELIATLRGLDCRVGIYGDSPDADGDCTYDFAMGHALYQNAKITISDSQWPSADGYTSNRIFQAMSAGCFVLNQRFAGCEQRLGYVDGIHFVGFDNLDELPALITKWLKKGNDPHRNKIRKAGQTLTLERHSFEARVKQLFEELLPEVSRDAASGK